jgi:hypothetical protein
MDMLIPSIITIVQINANSPVPLDPIRPFDVPSAMCVAFVFVLMRARPAPSLAFDRVGEDRGASFAVGFGCDG